MAGYADTKKLIEDTLVGRPAGTLIYPEGHQAIDMSLLDYIHSVELLGASELQGIATTSTVPVQPDNAKVSYIATVPAGQTYTFTNFHDENGNSISITAGANTVSLLTFLWNGEYWQVQNNQVQLMLNITEGYLYAGIAIPTTNPGSPDQPVFYIAAQAGTYTNFGGIVVNDGEAAILKYVNSSWVKETSGLVTREELHTLYNSMGYAPYIKNVYILPSTQAKFNYLKTLSSRIQISYLGVRNPNLGGDSSIFGLQLHIDDSNVCSYWINYVPDLSKNLIVELIYSSGTGEISNGFRIYVEFNPTIDLVTPSGLLSYQTYVRPFVNTQTPLVYGIEFLNKIINDGFIFKGVATPSTNPNNERSFYIASTAGEYSNFSSSIYIRNGEVAVLMYNGSWSKQVISEPYFSWSGRSSMPTAFLSWFERNVDALLYFDPQYKSNRKYTISYLMLNHSALGGTNYFGVQVTIKDSAGTTIETNNYRLLANALQPNSTYKFQADSGQCQLFIRTPNAYSWDSTTYISSGNLMVLNAQGLGRDVLPFLFDVEQKISDLQNFDNKLGKTFEVINAGGLTPQQIGLIADIYVVGNIDIPVGGYLGISYVTLNNSNIGGTGKLGFQFAFNIGDVWSRQSNCYVDATEFEPGKLYKFDRIEKGSTVGAMIDEIYIRTSDTFVWPSDDVIKNTQIKITEFGYGKSVQPFYLASINRPAQNNIITVGKGAGFDYNTLTAATNAAPSGSTIIVYPGVYENECVTAGTTKTLYIIGVDRDKCVIKNNLGEYQYAVIHIASGLLRNLTVIQEGTDPGQTSGAYGVHADFNPGQNSTLRIENCHLQSNVPNTGGIGIGLRKDMHLTIKGCRLVSGTSGRALYAHDDDGGSGGAQYLHVIDCILESPNQAILIQGQGKPDRDFSVQQYYIEFCRNIIKGTISFINWYSDPGVITADDFQGVKNLRLLETSWGNSASVLNNTL